MHGRLSGTVRAPAAGKEGGFNHEWIKVREVLVAGTGKSGIAAAKLILNRGGEVVLYDGNTALDEKRSRPGLKRALR